MNKLTLVLSCLYLLTCASIGLAQDGAGAMPQSTTSVAKPIDLSSIFRQLHWIEESDSVVRVLGVTPTAANLGVIFRRLGSHEMSEIEVLRAGQFMTIVGKWIKPGEKDRDISHDGYVEELVAKLGLDQRQIASIRSAVYASEVELEHRLQVAGWTPRKGWDEYERIGTEVSARVNDRIRTVLRSDQRALFETYLRDRSGTRR